MRADRDLFESMPAPIGYGTSDAVPSLLSARTNRRIGGPEGVRRRPGPPLLLRPAGRKALRQQMLRVRRDALERLTELNGTTAEQLREYRRTLAESPLPDHLIARGAGPAFHQEFPQGALLYLLTRSLRPDRVVETGVRPGYSTAWVLAALEANRAGTLVSLGPGNGEGRRPGVRATTVGQFVPPGLRARWTLELGNRIEQLDRILGEGPVDLFLYDNGPDLDRARYELRRAWASLSPDGVLLAHRIGANSAWEEFCRHQGRPSRPFEPGPPPLGLLAVRR